MWAVWELDRNKRGQSIEDLQQSIAGIDSPPEEEEKNDRKERPSTSVFEPNQQRQSEARNEQSPIEQDLKHEMWENVINLESKMTTELV